MPAEPLTRTMTEATEEWLSGMAVQECVRPECVCRGTRWLATTSYSWSASVSPPGARVSKHWYAIPHASAGVAVAAAVRCVVRSVKGMLVVSVLG